MWRKGRPPIEFIVTSNPDLVMPATPPYLCFLRSGHYTVLRPRFVLSDKAMAKPVSKTTFSKKSNWVLLQWYTDSACIWPDQHKVAPDQVAWWMPIPGLPG